MEELDKSSKQGDRICVKSRTHKMYRLLIFKSPVMTCLVAIWLRDVKFGILRTYYYIDGLGELKLC